MQHVFKVKKLGWDEEEEGITFDADVYSEEEVKSAFEEYEGTTMDGYPYIGYEYDGERFHDVTYLGVFEDDEVPHNDDELMEALANRS